MLSRENGAVSRRRRALLLGVVVLALGAGGVVALTARGGELPMIDAPAQDLPGPVLLVPGYGGATAPLQRLANLLERNGRATTIVRVPGDGTGDLRDSARALDAAADRAIAGGASSVDVVGYSAGGVIARYWVRELGGGEQARRIVTLGSPHHGTELAKLGTSLAPGACPTGCRQLVPGSELLDDLNAGDETPDGPQWLTLWTAQDEVVTPPTSARLEGAVEVQLQDVCPGLALTHGDLPVSPLVGGLVLRALAVADIAPPAPGDCETLQAAGS